MHVSLAAERSAPKSVETSVYRFVEPNHGLQDARCTHPRRTTAATNRDVVGGGCYSAKQAAGWRPHCRGSCTANSRKQIEAARYNACDAFDRSRPGGSCTLPRLFATCGFRGFTSVLMHLVLSREAGASRCRCCGQEKGLAPSRHMLRHDEAAPNCLLAQPPEARYRNMRIQTQRRCSHGQRRGGACRSCSGRRRGVAWIRRRSWQTHRRAAHQFLQQVVLAWMCRHTCNRWVWASARRPVVKRMCSALRTHRAMVCQR